MDISNTELGKQTAYPTAYDAGLLFPIERKLNREKYQIDAEDLPFVGYDVWNCYEVSFLTNNNLPITGILKISYSAESEFIVESKSLKIYLNSFNLEKLGESIDKASQAFQDTVKQDLTRILRLPVNVSFFLNNYKSIKPFGDFHFTPLRELIEADKYQKIRITDFKENPELLVGTSCEETYILRFQSDLLRSNCPVTNQPDWGDLFCVIESNYIIKLESIVQYLVSFRKENHFHEEVVEMIYKRLFDKFSPKRLLVAAMYTRRGGIDINPIRASHQSLLDPAFLSTEFLLAKTPRQ